MKAIILAAGGGSRLAPIGLTLPKLLVPILNQPLIHYHINAIRNVVDEAIIAISPNQFGQQIQLYINHHDWPLPISTVIQPQPLGTANSYQAAADRFGSEQEAILGLNGDDLYSPDDIAALTKHQFAVLGEPVDDPSKWGMVQTDANNNLIHLVEKPTSFVGHLAYTGAFVATTEIFDLYREIQPSLRGEYEVTDTLSLLATKHPVKAVTVQDYWLPIGYPWHILQTNQRLLTEQHLHPPIIGHNVTIGKNTKLIGTVVIGDNVTIGDHAIIEGSTIFDHTTIGDHSHISHSVIGKHATIGQQSKFLSQDNSSSIKSMIKGEPVNTGLVRFGAVVSDHVGIGQKTTIHPGCKI